MKKVFLSFAKEDTSKVMRLLPLLANPEYGLDYCEEPPELDFNSDAAKDIKRKIGEKIVNSNITVCLISDNTCKSKWVDCALKKSRDKGSKIIAMAIKGTECALLPEVIREENLPFYPWNPQRLVEFIIGKEGN